MNPYGQQSHQIDYRIFGEEMQCVEIELDPAETAIAESGAFMMMDDGISMQTIFVNFLIKSQKKKMNTPN